MDNMVCKAIMKVLVNAGLIDYRKKKNSHVYGSSHDFK